MKHILTFCILLVTLYIASPAQSWNVYNRSTAADSELLDGLDSTAFTLQSTFNTYTAISFTPLSTFSSYTSTAGDGGGSPFDNITVTGTAAITKIIAGTLSTATGAHSTISGGYSGEADGAYATSAGGKDSNATGDYSVVSGGQSNQAISLYSFAGGGQSNYAYGVASVISGGSDSDARGSYSFVGGGFSNDADASYSSALGGHFNSIGTTGDHSVIIGGKDNSIAGEYSMAWGRDANLDSAADRTFVDIYGTSAVNVTIPDAHIIYGAAGYEKKVGIQVLDPDDTLDVDGTAQITGNVTLDSGILFTGMVTTYDNYSVGIGDYTVFAHATSSTKDMYLPDATTVDGMHLRFKKKDATSNHITINATGAQTIDGNGSKVLEQTNNAITLYSNGSNWEVLQATSVAHFGEMHVHDNSTATDISTANSPHLIQGLFAEEDTDGFTFVAGSTGPISAFTEYSTVVSGTTKVTDVDHGLSSGAIISISGTTSYNDVFEVTVIDSANYYITDTFVDDDATGNWYEGDKLVNTTGKTGKYKVEFHGFGTPQTNNDILEFHTYKDAVGLMPLESKRKFTSSTDVGAISASGLTTIADGEAITFSIINTSGTGNFTLEHVNVVIHSF